ncbi:hypothetical protein [Sinorhizobium chiapasense]|uniref:Lipoprotein n=1 Tax=Sinorhizobium chiapasense TaxID=501572 RepID=A0ABZ2B838_9HYPH
MKTLILFTLIAAGLSGCMTATERAARDDAECQSYGARPGSDAYVNCRVAQGSIRAQQAQASAQRRMASQQAYWNTVNSMNMARMRVYSAY